MIKKYLPIVAVLFMMLSSQQVNAQDPHFSQFYMAPLHLNPAMTGVFEGNFRVNANYREQWTSALGSNPFRTIGASFDFRKNIVKGDYMAVGISGMRDEAGESFFTQNRGHLSLSYLKQLGGSRYSDQVQYLVAGGQIGVGQNSINAGNLWFSSQFDDNSVSVNQNASNNEANLTGSSDMFLDFNAGILWYALLDDNASIYVGGALNHLNAPQVSLYDNGNETLYSRWVGHAGGEIPLTNELSLLPAIAVMGQGPSFQTNFGTNFRYSNHDWREVAIRAGLWVRLAGAEKADGGSILNDAFIVSAILEMERVNVGISYDINASSLKLATQSRGAFELSMTYINPAKRRFKIKCPKF